MIERLWRLNPLRNILMIVPIIFLLFIPHTVLAHASLEKASPAPDSRLSTAPKEIILLFNERLEGQFSSIQVYDSSGEVISKSKTRLSTDQKQVTQDLPKLANGNYTISYSVVSADGHPVKGSYMMSIGNGIDEKVTAQQDVSENQSFTLLSVVRIIYFIILLLVTGWVLWGTIGVHEECKIRYRRWALYLQTVFFLANIGMGYIQAAELLDSWNFTNIASFLTGTIGGISWWITMSLSILGFMLLFRNRWLDRIWVLFLLATKSVNGHAFAYDSPVLTVSIDIIHLLAASIWAGGLLYCLIFWKKHRSFLVTFSKTALFSMILLTITGVAATLLSVPELSYLLLTPWGRLLLVKMILVLFVIIAAKCLRYYMQTKKEGSIGKWLKIDFALMLAIVTITAIFTHLNPQPENKPFNWHESGDKLEYMVSISPKIPGMNLFMVDARSLVERVKIKRVELLLINIDRDELGPIRVPFSEYKQAEKVHYMIEGKYLPFPGNWRAEIRILDSDDNEKVFHRDFVVY